MTRRQSLANLRTARRELAGAAVLEAAAVRAALEAGLTYQELGEALGISRSAAARRYRHLLPAERRRERTP